MVYDFSKNKVSVKELSEKKQQTVTKLKKKSSQTTPVESKSTGLSDSWNKDKVTLEEAKQQSVEAREYMEVKHPQSVVETVDDGTTVTTTETSTRYPDIKVGSNVKSTAQTEAIVTKKVTSVPSTSPKKESPVYTPVNQSYTPSPQNPEQSATKKLTGDQAAYLNDVLNTKYDSGNGIEGSKFYTPTETISRPSTVDKIVSKLQDGYNAGYDPENKTIDSSLDYDYYKNNVEWRNYQKSEKAATYLNNKAATVIDAVTDNPIQKKIQQSEIMSTAYDNVSPVSPSEMNRLLKGGVSAATGLLPFAAGSILAVKVLDHEPEKLPAAAVTGLGIIAGSTVKLAETDPYYLAGNIAGSVAIARYGGDAARVVRENAPTVKPATLTSIESAGASPKLSQVEYGIQFSAGNKPLLSFSKEAGLTKGGLAASPSILEGKTITAFGDVETANFMKTVAKTPDADYFGSGYNIAKSVHKTPTPVKEPTSFEITSQNIPDNLKPAVKDTVVNYKGDVEVYGSVSQKMQMQEYMSRTPNDLEVVADNPTAFVNDLKSNLGDAKYRISGEGTSSPKVEFEIGGQYHKGIEIFSKEPEPVAKGEYRPSQGIAYGFNEKPPIDVDGIKIMNLQEQGARKLAGGLTLKDGSIEPVHFGRTKDVGDIIEIGVGHAIEKNPAIASDVLKFNKLAAAKYDIDSPVSKFILENERIPTKSEFSSMSKAQKEMIFERSMKQPRPHGYSPSMFDSVVKSELMVSSFMSPRPSSFSPKGSSFIPKGSSFVRKPSNYIRNTSSHVAPPSSHVAPPSSIHSPIPSSISVLPKRFKNEYPVTIPPFMEQKKHTTKKGKGKRTDWQYDRLYNNFRSIDSFRL